MLIFVEIIYEQYEAGDGKSSTYFFGLKWSIRFDFAKETPEFSARSFAKFSFTINLFFLSSWSREENLWAWGNLKLGLFSLVYF